MEKLTNDITHIVREFHDGLQAHLPALEKEVNALIQRESRNESQIENMLDTLHSLTMHGVADDLFIRLLEYYKTVNSEGADWYWNEYDKEEEE